MNSPFSINSKTHRAKYQQPMCGTTIFNIGAPPSYNFGSSILNHFNRNFSMSSCNLGLSQQQQQTPHVGIDINKGIKSTNGEGILSNLINLMKARKPILQASAKEFPDFNHMPMSSASSSFCMVEPKQKVYLNSTNVQTPSYSYFTTPESAFSANASNTENTMNDLKSYVSANCTQDDALVPETTKSCGQSFMNKKKKKRSGKGKNKAQSNHHNNNNINTNKFHHHASNLHKNLHEKERHCIERDITDDYCDILGDLEQVDEPTESEPAVVVLPENVSKDEVIPVELNRTFEFYSLEEFPEILQDCPVALSSGINNKKRTTNKCTKSQKASKLTAKRQDTVEDSDTDDEFIIFKDDTPDSTPSFSPKPMNLCTKIGKIIKKPSSPLKSSFSPCKILAATKLHCMKPKRERFLSECSDDSFVVFCDSGASSSGDVNQQTDFDSELDMSDDDSDDSESDDDLTDGDDGDVEDETPEAQQLDSGIEERKVIYLNQFKCQMNH